MSQLLHDQLDYQFAVNRLLKGSPYREQRVKEFKGVLSREEMEQMERARLKGIPAEAFARQLLEIELHNVEIAEKTLQLYTSDPTCGVCRKGIDTVENAHLQTLVDGSAYLVHPDCFSASIHAMAQRFFGRPRQVRSA